MATQVTVLTIFLSCSSEMSADKSIIAETVGEVNRLLDSVKVAVQYKIWDWKLDAVGGVSKDVQSVIDEQIPEHDVYLGAMWKKFGEPTRRFGSGTEHEFRNSLSNHKSKGIPRNILFFFKTAITSLVEINAAELIKIAEFKSGLGTLGVLYHDYASEDELKGYLRMHLIKIAQEWKSTQKNASEGLSSLPIIREDNVYPLVCGDEGGEFLDEALGFLDYAEEYQDTMGRATELIYSLTAAMVNLGSSMHSRAQHIQIDIEKYGKGKVPLTIMRKSSDLASDDMIAFSILANPLIEEAERNFNSGFASLLKALETYQTGGFPQVDKSELTTISNSLGSLYESVSGSEKGLQDLRMGALTVPQLSAKIKRGVRSISGVVDSYSKMCASMRSKISNLQALIETL